MRQRDMAIKILLAATQRDTNAAGSAIDLQGTINPLGREVKAILDVGAVAGTSPTLDVAIQESATTTAADFTAITGAAFTQVSTTGNQELHFKVTKRYVRAVSTVGGTSPKQDFGVYLLTEKLQQ